MNLRRTLVVTLIAGALLSAPLNGTVAQVGPGSSPPEPLPERVLFIGNSHTSRHGGLDWFIGSMVAAEPEARRFTGELHTTNGVTLEYHYRNGAPDRIRTGDYDTVVLQGFLPHSSTGTIEPFRVYARRLGEIAREAGADVVFYMTWPMGHDDWSTVEDAVEAHRAVEAELEARVAPAAIAFERARAQRPDLELIAEDRIHATWEGAYLAAATLYAALFGRNPEELDFRFGVGADDAAFLQRIAWETVTEWEAGAAADG